MSHEIPSLATSTGPDLAALLEEYRRAGSVGDYWARQSAADDIRLARWDSQSDDGKKWDDNQIEGEPAFPWNGASDVRAYQADEVINENVATEVAAFWRSDIRVEGVEPGDLANASSSTRFLEWIRDNSLRSMLEEEVELAAQFKDWYGWCALHISWERQLSYRWRTLTLDELVQLAQGFAGMGQIPDSSLDVAHHLIAFPQLIAHPEQEDQAIKSLQFLYRVYVKAQMPEDMQDEDIPDLSKGKARTGVRELRKDGKTKIPFPYLCKNRPVIAALKPWRDIVVPTDTTDLQSARAIFLRQFWTEAQVRAMGISQGWDEEFIEEAIRTKGRLSVWQFSNQGLLNPLWQWSFTNQRNNLIEIIVSYHKAVDEDGLIGVYQTIFSAHVTMRDDGNTPILGKQGLLEGPVVDEYPIVFLRREFLDRQVMSSRSVAELCSTSQREEKVLRDAVMDWCSIGIIPPMNIPTGSRGQKYQFAPAAQNMVTAGREPKLMAIENTGPIFATEYLQQIRTGVDHYFGRVREDVPPVLSQMLSEPRVRRFLNGWAQALKLAFQYYLHYSPDMFERVTGQPAPTEQSMDLDFLLHFDVAQLNPDMMEKKWAAMSSLIPEDSAGVLDKAQMTRIRAKMIDPAMAKQITMDQGSASQQLFDKVKSDLVAMSDGNEASYTDAANDPTAQGRAQYLRQLIANNLKYMHRLDPQILMQLGISPPPGGDGQGVDPIFSALLEKYLKNLQLAVSQQQNKVVGRIGVAAA